MAGNAVELPAGFVLDAPAGAGNALPPGFVLDAPAAGGMPDIPGFTPMQVEQTPGGEFVVPANKGSIQPIAMPSTASDIATSFGRGVRDAAIATPGLPGSLEALGRAGINFVARHATGHNVVDPTTILPTGQDMIEGVTGTSPEAQDFRRTAIERFPGYAKGLGITEAPLAPANEPQTRAGQFARAVGEFSPGAVMPGSLVQRALVNTALPAVASEAAGQATEGTAFETPSRIAAAMLAPTVPRVAMRAVTPLPAAANRTAMANALADQGVELTAGQRTGGRALRFAESNAREMPFAGGNIAGITERQGEQLVRSALRRAGENGPETLATPPELAAARARISADFDRIMQHPLPLNRVNSQRMATELGGAFRTYRDTVPNSMQRNAVEGFMQDMLDEMTTSSGRLRASIPGEKMQRFRSRLTRMASETTDPEYRAFLASARDTLDDIYGAALPPGEAAAWAAARNQWRHLMVIEDAVAGSPMGTPYGTFSPASLRRASRRGNPQAYAEGRGTLSDLGHAAGTVMDSLPNSGTPARLAIGWGIPGAVAGGVADVLTGTPGAGTLSGAGVASLLGPPLQARIVSNPRVQAYLGNQVLAGPLNAGAMQPASAVARALMLPAQMPETLGGR